MMSCFECFISLNWDVLVNTMYQVPARVSVTIVLYNDNMEFGGLSLTTKEAMFDKSWITIITTIFSWPRATLSFSGAIRVRFEDWTIV